MNIENINLDMATLMLGLPAVAVLFIVFGYCLHTRCNNA